MRKRRRSTRIVMGITIAIPIFLCVAVVLGLCFDYFKFTQAINQATIPKDDLGNFFTAQSVTLALVGIAISVWIGLNIYNALAKEELKSLLNQAETASAVIEKVYAEVLKSKFRMSGFNTENGYFLNRFEKIDVLPIEILVKMIQVEDLFELAYRLYGSDYSGVYNKDGISASNELREIIEFKYANLEIDRKQYKFLMGYLELRIGDFLYFDAKHTSDLTHRGEIALEAIKHYKKSLENLFNISNYDSFENPKNVNQEERQCIAYLANDIGSAYLQFVLPTSVHLKEVEDVIKLENIAFSYSEYMAPNVREVFARNLGAAYEKDEKIDTALSYYAKAHSLNPSNWKSAHCIGACYRNMVKKKYPRLFESSFLNHPEEERFSPEEIEEITNILNKSCYWFRIKQLQNNGEIDKNLETINQILFNLTKKEEYLQELQRYRNEEEIVKSLSEEEKSISEKERKTEKTRKHNRDRKCKD